MSTKAKFLHGITGVQVALRVLLCQQQMLLGIHFPELIDITTVPSHVCMGIPETRHDSATFSIAYSNIRVPL